MSLILYWAPVVEKIEKKLKEEFSKSKWKWKYIAIFLLQDHGPSKVYVNKKKQFGTNVWIAVNIIDWKQINDLSQLLEKINQLNNDTNCVWIVVQLPLPQKFIPYQSLILSKIKPEKDIDWLWWVLFWLSQIGLINFIPATPKAAIRLLEFYGLDNFKWKKISILWQSNLVWKPLALEIIKRGGNVFSFNHYLSNKEKKQIVKNSDYIFSATGNIHLIDDSRINTHQIIVDIWWGYKDKKPAGDVNFDLVKNKVKAITPVPGWVWPLTVACLFENILEIDKLKKEITN